MRSEKKSGESVQLHQRPEARKKGKEITFSKKKRKEEKRETNDVSPSYGRKAVTEKTVLRAVNHIS